MLSVKLVDHGIQKPIDMIIADARTCYSPEEVVIGAETMDVEARVFNTGHHTTIMAPSSFSFQIEGASVSTFTFGLHLANPFYNSGQRSGRFCSDMFKNLDVTPFREKLKKHFDIDEALCDRAIAFIQSGVNIFQGNLEVATKVVEEFIRVERPKATDKYIAANAGKIAQEQLRVFISTIVPTADLFNINLVTLACYYRTAFTSEMREVVDMMATEVLIKWPELEFLFPTLSETDYCPELDEFSKIGEISYAPNVWVTKVDEWPDDTPIPTNEEMFPLDTQHSDPRFMGLTTRVLKSTITLSMMTMGQDQRHRTISRSKPILTGQFFVPAVVNELGLSDKAKEFMTEWTHIYCQNPMLATFMAPYGVVLTYEKCSEFAALIHEQGKRTCNCAQGEIYEIARQMREQITAMSPTHKLLELIAPPCYRSDQCAEGARYCGRDLSIQFDFPLRNI